jgi:hypothetical protein
VTVTNVYKKARVVTEFIVGSAAVAALIMVGPILQSIGWLKG